MNPLDKLEIKLITEILKRQSKTEYTLDVDSNKYRCSTCTRAFSRLKIMTNHCYTSYMSSQNKNKRNEIIGRSLQHIISLRH